MQLQDFPGGLYAVLRLADPFAAPYEIIPGGWKQLVMWAEDNNYQLGSHQYLEEHLLQEVAASGGWSMDLYFFRITKR
jgi:AraC family transcriptional regulator